MLLICFIKYLFIIFIVLFKLCIIFPFTDHLICKIHVFINIYFIIAFLTKLIYLNIKNIIYLISNVLNHLEFSSTLIYVFINLNVFLKKFISEPAIFPQVSIQIYLYFVIKMYFQYCFHLNLILPIILSK